MLRQEARFGLIVYCASHAGDLRLEAPEGNDFPTVEALESMLDRASLRVQDSGWTDHFAAFPADWEDVMATVQRESSAATVTTRAGRRPRSSRAGWAPCWPPARCAAGCWCWSRPDRRRPRRRLE